MRIKLCAAMALLVLGTSSCVSDRVTGESRFSLVEWTPEEELAMGREYAPNIEAEFDAIHPDAEANEALRELVGNMVALSPRQGDFDFHFKLLNSSVPNALALPGGYVYITRGLLQEMETEAQFISVMGHELGHVEHRHAMLNQSQGTLLGLGTRPLGAVARRLPIGRGAATLAVGLASAPSALLGLKFNRGQELEADERGVYFSAEMGYDPSDAKRTFELFQRLESETPRGLADHAIFRTHPMNKDRIGHIEKTIEKEYPELAGRPHDSFRADSTGFDAILTRLRAKKKAYELYDQAQAELSGAEQGSFERAAELLREARMIEPEEPLFHILDGELALVSEDLEGAIGHFMSAIELYRKNAPGEGHWKPHLYLGVFQLQAGDASAAVMHLRRAAELFPMNGEIHYFLGQALEAAGRPDKAEQAYRRAMELLPSDSEAHKAARSRLKSLRM